MEPAFNKSHFYELGNRFVWGGTIPFGLSTASREHNVRINEKSGAEKSSLLRNLVLEIISGGGVCLLIAPQGDGGQEVRELFPPHRADLLFYFNPADVDHQSEEHTYKPQSHV